MDLHDKKQRTAMSAHAGTLAADMGGLNSMMQRLIHQVVDS